MNSRNVTFDVSAESWQVDEVVSSIFHTVLFLRSTGKFIFKSEEDYFIKTVDYAEVECDFLDFAYVRCQSEALNHAVNGQISAFSRLLRSVEASPPCGVITLEFYHKERATWPFQPKCVAWETWTVRCEVAESRNERDNTHLKRQSVEEMLQEKVEYVTDIVNRHEYVPKMPRRSDLDLVFDTSYADIQPYLFEIRHNVSGAPLTPAGNALTKMFWGLF
ncbi:autophagy-related protein 101-like [Melitaea cinxia]|uniref:autophagy-related protein 101-like n=1 Tax=Melitaea cinxia TaxID=113334 RepID=UPI001E274B4E|nr:autophagy-related protein 101-like [Melitaea cinxia]